MRLFNRLYHSPLLGQLFHTSVYCLKRELADCQSALDLGCGPDSPVRFVKSIQYSVGVEPFEPYARDSESHGIHTELMRADLRSLRWPAKSFDAVLLLGVIEHLPKHDGKTILALAEQWARKKVVISCPNGFLPQGTVDENPYQSHQSGWTAAEMAALGYRVYGMTGWKALRKENTTASLDDDDAFLATIRFRPRPLWLALSALTQMVTYYTPAFSFELFCVKELHPSSTDTSRVPARMSRAKSDIRRTL